MMKPRSSIRQVGLPWISSLWRLLSEVPEPFCCAGTGGSVVMTSATARLHGVVTNGGEAPNVIPALTQGTFMIRGTTLEERSARLPGDDIVPDPRCTSTRAITIDAPAEDVWPWIAQMGQGRAGMYSYELLENLFGCDMHNADRIVPALQAIVVGDRIRDGSRRIGKRLRDQAMPDPAARAQDIPVQRFSGQCVHEANRVVVDRLLKQMQCDGLVKDR
jgi:hypothetical protein